MKYIYTLSILLFISSNSFGQELNKSSDAIILTKLIHGQQLGFRLDYIKQIKKLENPKEEEGKEVSLALYKKIAEAYQQAFTAKELKELYTFYRTPLGKKLLESRDKLATEVSIIASKWEMEQQGIFIEEIAAPIYKDGKLTDTNGLVIEEVAVKTVEKVFPEIKNLQDLKKLLLKDPYMIADQRLLSAIIGKKEMEKLFNPEYLLPEKEKQTKQ
jgi:hypothetical protein